MFVTCAAFLGGVTQAHPLEWCDIDGRVTWHQAGVITAQNVGTLVTIGFAQEAGINSIQLSLVKC